MAARLLVLVALLAAACSGSGQPVATRTPQPSRTAGAGLLPVAHPTVWLCHPDAAADPCLGGLDATVVDAAGRARREAPPRQSTPVDCFYVYPTVSEATALNAPLVATAAEVRTVRAQAALFSSVCRVFAPVYRQLTVHALLTGRFGDAAGRELAHRDVVSAFHDYLNHNPGRRFVLLGHSQGSFELLRLLQEEVDGDPALRARLVSALLPGGSLKVPAGRDVGGDLQNIPLCRTVHQHGCVVAYNTYAGTPPGSALFGRADPARHLVAACTNPAALAGGSALLHPYFPTAAVALGSLSVPGAGTYGTGFVTYPGYVRAQCHQSARETWLQVTAQRVPHDPRPVLRETLGPQWGLHVVDVSIALGDLVALVRDQSG